MLWQVQSNFKHNLYMLTVNNVCVRVRVCVYCLHNINKINFTASLENMQTTAKEIRRKCALKIEEAFALSIYR